MHLDVSYFVKVRTEKTKRSHDIEFNCNKSLNNKQAIDNSVHGSVKFITRFISFMNLFRVVLSTLAFSWQRSSILVVLERGNTVY